MITKQQLYAIFLILFVLYFPLKTTQSEQKTPPEKIVKKIAIVGAGVGGTSAAYFINELLSKQTQIQHEVTIYEKSYRVGGRLHTVTIDNRQYEAGGSIIHNRNKYAVSLMAKFGLKKRNTPDDNRLCIYNGEKFVFCESSWQIITLIRLLQNYGFDPIRLQKRVSSVIDFFEKIYELQKNYNAYEKVDDLLMAMDSYILNLTQIKYHEILTNEYTLSRNFINEIVQAVSLVNYGQTLTIPALVGLVSFAGSGNELFAIEGGNKLLPLHLAHYSDARLSLNTQVVSVTYLGDHKFRVDSKKLDVPPQKPNLLSQIYDYVIIAAPLASENNAIRFNNFTKQNELINDIFEKYHLHRTMATFVKGQILEKYKDLTVLSCDIDREEGGSFFTSLSKLSPVTRTSNDINKKQKNRTPGQKNIYKIFSNHRLNHHELYSIFEDIEDVQEINWFAYPDYKIQPLPFFRIYRGVYYLNAIEWAASAIEMSLIGGKNVALLVCQDLDICIGSEMNSTKTSSNKLKSRRKLEL